MELRIIHHWQVQKSHSITELERRLMYCFRQQESLPLDIPVYDWELLLGSTLSVELQSAVHEVCLLLGVNANLAISIAQNDLIEALQRDWYFIKGHLFIAETIEPETLKIAIIQYLHEKKLRGQ